MRKERTGNFEKKYGLPIMTHKGKPLGIAGVEKRVSRRLHNPEIVGAIFESICHVQKRYCPRWCH